VSGIAALRYPSREAASEIAAKNTGTWERGKITPHENNLNAGESALLRMVGLNPRVPARLKSTK